MPYGRLERRIGTCLRYPITSTLIRTGPLVTGRFYLNGGEDFGNELTSSNRCSKSISVRGLSQDATA